MDRKRRSRLDFLQNAAIVLLTLSAVLLFAQTQLYSLGSEAGAALVHRLLNGDADPVETAAGVSASLPAPVRVVVTGVYSGRYGNVAMTTADDTFEPLGSLLREALGSASPVTACSRQDFLNALNTTSVYWDFLEPLPLAVLAQLTGAVLPDGEDLQVRRLVLSEGDDGAVALYLWGQETWRCGSAVPPEELARTVSGYELNGAVFAMDDPDLSALAPCALLPAELPELPVLSAGVSLPDTETLLSLLGFYPRTNSRYPETGGAEVITEGSRRLRVGTDGTVQYWSGGEEVLSVKAAGETPTVSEAIAGAEALLNTLLTPWSGEARLYLQGVRQEAAGLTLTFGYQLGGIPIRFFDGSPAAELQLTGKTVSGLMMRYRQYTAAEEQSLLLPLRQARAIAAEQAGTELSIGYADGGGISTLSASWLMD